MGPLMLKLDSVLPPCKQSGYITKTTQPVDAIYKNYNSVSEQHKVQYADSKTHRFLHTVGRNVHATSGAYQAFLPDRYWRPYPRG